MHFPLLIYSGAHVIPQTWWGAEQMELIPSATTFGSCFLQVSHWVHYFQETSTAFFILCKMNLFFHKIPVLYGAIYLFIYLTSCNVHFMINSLRLVPNYLLLHQILWTVVWNLHSWFTLASYCFDHLLITFSHHGKLWKLIYSAALR